MTNPAQHSMTEALQGQKPAEAGKPEESGPPRPTHDQVAEQARREEEARPASRPDRDELLVNVGRGQQTHG